MYMHTAMHTDTQTQSDGDNVITHHYSIDQNCRQIFKERSIVEKISSL